MRLRSRDRLFQLSGVKQPAYGGDAVGRQSCPPGMFPDGVLVRSDVHAIHLIFRYVTVQPLDLRSDLAQGPQRAQRHLLNLGLGEGSGAWHLAFDDVLWHAWW